jgi:hypothetical protein
MNIPKPKRGAWMIVKVSYLTVVLVISCVEMLLGPAIPDWENRPMGVVLFLTVVCCLDVLYERGVL